MLSLFALIWLGASLVSCLVFITLCIASSHADAKAEKTRVIYHLQRQQENSLKLVGEIIYVT